MLINIIYRIYKYNKCFDFSVVTATDTEGAVGLLEVTIEIGDVNEFAPMFNTSGIESTIDENLPVGTTLFAFTASDADGTDEDSEVKEPLNFFPK